MKILFAKVFGIGNAVMSIPAIKALMLAGHQVDLLIGTLPDDAGSFEVLSLFKGRWPDLGTIWINRAPSTTRYDVAVLSIPFDGRWQNGRDFVANKVMDGRPRPDPNTTGLGSWKRHEVEYQMDNARALGFEGETPSCEFAGSSLHHPDQNNIYFGVGYKKDAAGFWKRKHWGNENFAEVARAIVTNTTSEVHMTGDQLDMQLSIAPIIRMCNGHPRVKYLNGGLKQSISYLSMCSAYVGNDTGMMHVAASLGIPVVSVFNLENSIVKSSPWSTKKRVFDGLAERVTPDMMLNALCSLGVL